MNFFVSENCCGCSACADICPQAAISMEMNEKGFFSARIHEEKCVRCGECAAICVFSSGRDFPRETAEPEAYAVCNSDYDKRLESQSGGAYALLAEAFLKDGGILYGVVYQNQSVEYRRVVNLDGLGTLKGSKYLQADIKDTFQQVRQDLEAQRKVLFAGTPCYVDGLKRYLRALRVSTENLYLIDLVCHGVPSPGLFRDYLEWLSVQYGAKITKFNFREKEFGWHSHICSFLAGEKEGFSDKFVQIFYSHVCLNESCYHCPYCNMERVGDVTLGDYWGIENVRPELDDNLGTSLLMVHTSKGRVLLQSIETHIRASKTVVADCLQPNLIRPTPKPAEYEKFWNRYAAKGFLAAVGKYCAYGEPEEDYEARLGWKLYQDVFETLKAEQIKRIFLYGIGITMVQILSYLTRTEWGIQVVGLLDRDKTRIGDTIAGYTVWDEREIGCQAEAVVLCTKKPESAAAIKIRLTAKNAYRSMRIVDLTERQAK